MSLTPNYYKQRVSCKEEYQAVAKACAENDFYLEPTGGIDLENFQEIVKIALDAGVEKVIPHVYSSIIDSATGDTRPENVRTLLDLVKELLQFLCNRRAWQKAMLFLDV